MPDPDPCPAPSADPRLRGFRVRATVEEVHRLIADRVGPLAPERIAAADGQGRVLAGPIVAGVDVPGFDRAAMDGYAVRGEDTFGADAYSPTTLRIVGRARPGLSSGTGIGPGEAVEIATGAALPPGADAVARVEGTERDGGLVHVRETTPPGKNVGRRGEDLARGDPVLGAGRILRPQDFGILSALGIAEIPAIRRPRVVVIATGDELLTPGTPPTGSSIADANSPMLAALVARDGGIAQTLPPMRDDRDAIRALVADAAGRADLVLISGGSSTGPEDHAPGIIAELGELAVHGVAIRPASPAGLGWVRGCPVALLPGNPVSCLCAYDFFAGPIARRLGGRPTEWPYRGVERPLARKLVSVVGRVDYARVRLVGDAVEPIAISGASILSSTTRADGFVVVPSDLEGYPAGATVRVWLYDA